MHLKIEQSSSDTYVFSLISGEDQIVRSDDESMPFLGEYGTYQTMKSALVASTLFAYRNFPTLTHFADLEDTTDSEGIKARAVQKFSRGIDIFLEMLEGIKKTKEKGDLKQRIQSIKQMIDQYAKSILDIAKEFENDSRVDNIPEDINITDIPASDLKSDQARDLLSLKSKLHLFYAELKSNFGDYIDVVASGMMRRVIASEEIPWYRDILSEYAEGITSALSLNGVETKSITDSADGYDIRFKTSNGDLTVSFSKDLVVNGIHPHDGLIDHFPPMSQGYYNALWYPIFKEIGNFKISENVIAIPKRASKSKKIGYSSDGSYLKDSFVAFDIRDGKEEVVDVFLNGKSCCGSRTCSFVVAGDRMREDRINSVLDQDAEKLMSAKMVRCVDTGTKYDGMVGEVQQKGIIRRETYLEIPVLFTFDNGIKETVTLTNDKVEVYA